MMTMDRRPNNNEGISAPSCDLHDMRETLDLDGRVVTLEESRNQRKQRGFCVSCPSDPVQTHRPGLWKKWLLMPQTVDGLVYKGVCLRCNTLAAAKLQRCEPMDDLYVPTTATVADSISQAVGRDGASAPMKASIFGGGSLGAEAEEDALAVAEGEDSQAEAEGNNVKVGVAPLNSKSGVNRGDMHLLRRQSLRQFGAKVKSSIKEKTNRLRTASGRTLEEVEEEGKGEGNESDEEKVGEDTTADFTLSENDAIIVDGTQQAGGSQNDHRQRRYHHRNNQSCDADAYLTQLDEPTSICREDDVAPEKMKVTERRCTDSEGRAGFYTGTINTCNKPQGRGQMVYDSGDIVRGVWSSGLLRIKVAVDRDRYVPYLLPGYSVGDAARTEDMAKLQTDETLLAASKLHVGDCAWVRRSNGTWSYAIVKSLADGGGGEDGEEASISFIVNSSNSTKTLTLSQWAVHLVLPAKPNVHPDYDVGDPGVEKDMVVIPKWDGGSGKKSSHRKGNTNENNRWHKFRVGDGSFVKRTDGSWAYSLVKSISDESVDDEMITFTVNANGSTKIIKASQCWKYVRRVNCKPYGDIFDCEDGINGISNEQARSIFTTMKSDEIMGL